MSTAFINSLVYRGISEGEFKTWYSNHSKSSFKHCACIHVRLSYRNCLMRLQLERYFSPIIALKDSCLRMGELSLEMLAH